VLAGGFLLVKDFLNSATEVQQATSWRGRFPDSCVDSTILAVPSAAFVKRNGHDVAFRIEDNRAVEVPVVIGSSNRKFG